MAKPVSGPDTASDTAAGGSGSRGQGQVVGQSGGSPMDDQSKIEMEGFLSTGRTGRRNAVPEISDPALASLSTADLPMNMAKMSCSESADGSSTGVEGKDSKQSSNGTS
ncbi:uncharacterized protein LOC143277141 isoform X2 [Babylonia areolata]|uniref:uncharacterized protein LOC143277141 isoform X2 n=1 Tax=Babylonia areolata TaxID=304850 RepID=UPI003FD207B9